ncbi:MAG: alpha/beta hydrolase [Deltaproteobacteria bacterium]|nr:MAG: alpha/beta hydrolase [Deltaproteobacteria bacterium]
MTAARECSYVEVNGIRFAYYEQGEGPLVLLFHGFPDTADTWREFMPALAEAGFRVVAPFMRGYAPTSIPEDHDYSSLKLGADVLGLIDALGDGKASIVGHDWGALACYTAAAMDMQAGTQKVEKLVTLAIPHMRALRPSLKALWQARHFLTFQFRKSSVRKVKKNNFAFLNDIFRRWSPRWDVTEEDLADVKRCFAQPGVPEASLGYYWSFRNDQRAPNKEKVQAIIRQKLAMPSLSLAGDSDGALDASAYPRTTKAFTGPYEYHILPNVGHFLHNEDPQACLAKILPFLKSQS